MTPSTTRAPGQVAGGAGGTRGAGGTLGDTRRGLWTGRDLGPDFPIIRGSSAWWPSEASAGSQPGHPAAGPAGVWPAGDSVLAALAALPPVPDL